MSSKGSGSLSKDELQRVSQVLFKDSSSSPSNPQQAANKLVEICRFILNRARYHQMHGPKLQAFLQDEAGMKGELAQLFALACNAETVARAADQSQQGLIYGAPMGSYLFVYDASFMF